MLFFVNSRYRLSVLPFLIPFSGFAIYQLWQRVKLKDFKQIGIYTGVLVSIFIILNANIVTPDTTTGRYNLALTSIQIGNYDSAIKMFEDLLKKNSIEELVKKNPNLFLIYFNLGICYYKKGMIDKAIFEFKETLRISPDHYDSHFNLGLIYFEKKDYVRAQEEFKKSLTMTDKDILAHYNLSRIYYVQGDIKKAEEEYKKILKLTPESIYLNIVQEDKREN